MELSNLIEISKQVFEISDVSDKANDPEHLSVIFMTALELWKQHIMYLNEQENIILAEYRDAILPELMSGKIEV